LPSIVILISAMSVGKPVPVKVIGSPPLTVPNLGEIAVRFGVTVEAKVMALVRSVAVPLMYTLGKQSCVSLEL
jgi:hypothetical protein